MSRLRIYGLFLVVTLQCFGQAANGKLQIHHIDMGQGDAAFLISPGGETVLFDAGEDIAQRKQCNVIVDYRDRAGVHEIDYLFVSTITLTTSAASRPCSPVSSEEHRL